MSEQERENLSDDEVNELLEQLPMPTEFMKKLLLLISKTHSMGLPDENGAANFLHDFVASDLSDIFNATSVSSGAVDGAMMVLFEDFCERGFIECVADFERPTNALLSHLLNDISIVLPAPTGDADEEKEWGGRPILSFIEAIKKLGSLTPEAMPDSEEDSRMITNMPTMQGLMYACFYMGAYSAKSLKTAKSLNNMWDIE